MDPAALLALSPIDGRYRKGADPLRAVLSESGLIRERVLNDVQHGPVYRAP